MHIMYSVYPYLAAYLRGKRTNQRILELIKRIVAFAMFLIFIIFIKQIKGNSI